MEGWFIDSVRGIHRGLQKYPGNDLTNKQYEEVDVLPMVLVDNPDLCSLNTFMTFEQQ